MSDVPSSANSGCPGTNNENAGKSSACNGCPNQKACSTGVKPVDPHIELIKDRLKNIKHIILILSGKGGVGKSTVATNLAFALANINTNDEQLNIGVLDVDICGPSQARLFGCEGESVYESINGWSPIYVRDNIALMSIAFLLGNRDEAVIWRGPRKNDLIKKFLYNIDWGESLDFLIIDTPPGTSDEHISIVQLLIESSNLDGAVIVSTPQEVALLDVRKEINFCQKTKVPILGVIENMSFLTCSCCSTTIELFPSTTGGAEKMCTDLNLDLIAKIPHDPKLSKYGDNGESYIDNIDKNSLIAKLFNELAKNLINKCQK